MRFSLVRHVKLFLALEMFSDMFQHVNPLARYGLECNIKRSLTSNAAVNVHVFYKKLVCKKLGYKGQNFKKLEGSSLQP